MTARSSPGIPAHSTGLRVGLLGGSFNPPHAAHRAISLFALKRLNLDRVWWLVTPGNPLKDVSALHSLAGRMTAARTMADDPRIDVSGVEAAIGTRYTADTLRYLKLRCPGVDFVWIMGVDNLAQFHRWQRWRDIAATIPIAVIDRAAQGLRGMASPAALALARDRLPERDAALLPGLRPPAWVFLTGLKLSASSTGMRNPDGSWKTAGP